MRVSACESLDVHAVSIGSRALHALDQRLCLTSQQRKMGTSCSSQAASVAPLHTAGAGSSGDTRSTGTSVANPDVSVSAGGTVPKGSWVGASASGAGSRLPPHTHAPGDSRAAAGAPATLAFDSDAVLPAKVQVRRSVRVHSRACACVPQRMC